MLSRVAVNFCRAALTQTTVPCLSTAYCRAPMRALSMSLPRSSTFYTEQHEWITMDNEVGTVGITKYAREQLGDIVYCELPEIGSTFAQGDSMAVMESVKAASDLYSPVSGEIVDVNSEVLDDPTILNVKKDGDEKNVKKDGDEKNVKKDGDEKNDATVFTEQSDKEIWLIKTKLSDTSELDDLMNAEEYAKFIAE